MALTRKERTRVKQIKYNIQKNGWCRKYMRGMCEEGSRCRWIHPRDMVVPWHDRGTPEDQIEVEEIEEGYERRGEEQIGLKNEDVGRVIENGENETNLDIMGQRSDRVETQIQGREEGEHLDRDVEVTEILELIQKGRDELRKNEQ